MQRALRGEDDIRGMFSGLLDALIPRSSDLCTGGTAPESLYDLYSKLRRRGYIGVYEGESYRGYYGGY